MSDLHTIKELRMAVEKQGQALLNAMARISSGELDHKVDIPDGVEILSDLGYGLTYLAQDMKLLLKRQKDLAKKLDKLKTQAQFEETAVTKQVVAKDPFLTPVPEAAPNGNGTGRLPLPSTGWLGNLPTDPQSRSLPEGDPLFDSNITRQPNFDSTLDVLGFLGFEGDQNLNLSQEESSALEDIAEQFGLALENQLLFEQTQQALLETELLYQISALLNQAESTEDILKAISSTIHDIDAISLWIVPDPDPEEEESKWLRLIENWSQQQNFPLMPVGSQIERANYPFLTALLDNGREATLVEDIKTDVRTAPDTNLQLITAQFEIVTYAFLPLTLGSNLVGLMIFGWAEERNFSKRDQPLYQAISAQVATAFNSFRQLKETQDRADRFAVLAQLEAELNQSQDEETVVTSLSSIFKSGRVALHYITAVNQEGPETMVLQASTAPTGDLIPNLKGQVFSLTDLPGYQSWQKSPTNYVHVADIKNSPFVKPEEIPLFEAWGTYANCVLPLFFAEAWQGIITISWDDPHNLTSIEKHILTNIREPLSAVIANRRTRLAEQKARQETEQLYAASQALNRAANSLNDTLAVTANLMPQSRITKVFLLSPEFDDNSQIVDLETTTSWSETTSGIMPNGTRIGNAAVTVIRDRDRVFFMDDKDEELPNQLKRLLKRIAAKSVCVVPLRLGPQISGYLLLASDLNDAFNNENIWILESIAPQISVAVQNSSLLADAQARARREELLREISEKIRGGADIDSVMKTAVSEIGRVLGRKAFLYLKTPSTEEETQTYE